VSFSDIVDTRLSSIRVTPVAVIAVRTCADTVQNKLIETCGNFDMLTS